MASIGNLGTLRVGMELPLKDWNKNYKTVTGDVKKYPKTTDKALDKADKAWEKHAKSIKAASIGMIAFGTAATVGFGMAVNEAATFQQSMANTQAVAGATSEELKQLTGFAREMGKQTVFSAKESADAMVSLASAGQNTNEIMNSLKGTLNLAAATNSDLAFTSRTVAATLSQFGFAATESDRIANVFTATISASQATMDKLSTSMSIVGPVAKAVGLSLEETAGILGGLFNAGLDASTAGTSLRQSLAQLLKPTDGAKEALARLNVETLDSQGNLRNLTGIIADLEKSGLGAADALAIFGVRAGPGMLALVSQGADSIRDLTEAVTGTDKAAEIAALMVETFEGQKKLLKSAVSELKITIGNELLPILTEYATKLTGIINKTSDWAAENPKLTKTLVTLGAAVSAIAIGLGGIGLAAPGIARLGPIFRSVGSNVALFGSAAVGGAAKFTVLGAAVTAVGVAAVTAGLAWWAYRRIQAAATRETDNAAIATKILTKRQDDLQLALEQIGGELNVFEQTGNRADATLQDLGIDADELTRVLGGNFVAADNASRVYAGLLRNFEKTTKETVELADTIKKLGPPEEAAAAKTKRLAKEMADLEKEVNALGTTLLTLPSAVSIGTTQIEREVDKSVAILKQRTKFEKDWIVQNGIIQLGLVEKNVDEKLTLLQNETKEARKIRIDDQKEERKAREEGLTGSLFVPETERKKVIKTRQKTAAESMKIAKDGSVQIAQLSGVVTKKQVEDINTVTKAQIEAGERRGLALQDEFDEQSDLLASAEGTWADYGNAVIDIFASVTKRNTLFADTWIGTLGDWAIGNRRILDTVSDLWSGKAASITGSAVSIFGTMTDLLISMRNAQKEMRRAERAEETGRIEKLMEQRGLTFTEAQDIVKGRRTLAGEEIDQEARRKAAREAEPRKRPGGDAVPTRRRAAPVDTGTVGAQPITPFVPFVPRGAQGTDRFGRAVAATPAMAPARGGNFTGDVIINLELPNVTDIRDMDSAEWESIFRNNIQPAAEATGLRFTRSDNLMTG